MKYYYANGEKHETPKDVYLTKEQIKSDEEKYGQLDGVIRDYDHRYVKEISNDNNG